MKLKLILFVMCMILSLAFVVASADVAYVLENTGELEQQFLNSITNLNYTYELIDDSEISSTNFSDYQVILIGNEDVGDISLENHKALILNPDYVESWSERTGTRASSQPLRADNSAPSHSITQGIPLNFPVYTRAKADGVSLPMYYLSWIKSFTEKIITAERDADEHVIVVREDPKQVFFGITRAEFWTDESKLLFENSLKWMINGDNQEPVFSVIPDIEWYEGETTQIDLRNYCSDPDDNELDFGVFNTSDNQEIFVNLSDLPIVKFSSTPGWNGEDWIIFYATDSKSTVYSDTVTLRVLQQQQNPSAPVLAPIGNKVVYENSLLEFTISATDPENDTLIFSVDNLPLNASFIDNNDNTASFSFTPGTSQIGTHQIKFKVKDTTDLEDSETITINVLERETPMNFSDVDLCEIINSDLKITIKEPDKNDDFSVGDEIEGEVKIKNSADEDMEVEVEFYLYDLDEDEEVDDFDDEIDVDEDETEELDFNLEVPDDAEEKHDFVLLVLARAEEDEDYCNYDFIEIDIEREDELVVIDKIEVDPEIVSPGGNLEVNVKVQNLGSDDQDVYITLENNELGISETTEEFELEEYDDEDTETKTFTIKIPEDAEEREYNLKARVFFDDGDEDNSETISFEVREETFTDKITETITSLTGFVTNDLISLRTQPEPIPKPTTTKITKTKPEKTSQKISFNFNFRNLSTTENQILLIIDLLLGIGILIEIILIVYLKRRGY